MSCIKSAIYLTRDFGGMDLEDRTENVIATARKLENYVTDFDDLPSTDELKIVGPEEEPGEK